MKLKERLAVGLGVSLVLVTILLIADLQMDLNMTPKQYLPMHGKVHIGNDTEATGVFQAFKRKFQFGYVCCLTFDFRTENNITLPLHFNRTFYSKEVSSVPAASVEISDNSVATDAKREPKDEFKDLQNVIQQIDSKTTIEKLSAKSTSDAEDSIPTLGEMIGIEPR